MADIKKNSDHVKKKSWSCRPAGGSHLHRNLVSWSTDYDVHRNQWEKLGNSRNEFSYNLLGKKLSEAGWMSSSRAQTNKCPGTLHPLQEMFTFCLQSKLPPLRIRGIWMLWKRELPRCGGATHHTALWNKSAIKQTPCYAATNWLTRGTYLNFKSIH